MRYSNSSQSLKQIFLSLLVIVPITATSVWADQPRQQNEVVAANGMRFQPAQMRISSEILGERIRMPAREGDFSVQVLCHAILDSSGDTQNVFCYNDEEDSEKEAFVKTVLHVLSGSKYYPVRVNGSRQPAIVPIAVRFTQKGAEQNIKVLMNHGQYQKFYGDDYYAAQVYDLGAMHHFGSSCGNETNPKVQLHVGTDGDVYEVAYVGGEASASCLQQLHIELQHVNATPLIYADGTVASRTQVPFVRRLAIRN